MGAFGIPADTQDMSPLYAWLRRNADLPFGLIMHNVDGMLEDVALRQQFADILANITKVRWRMRSQTITQVSMLTSELHLQAAPHAQLIVTAQKPTGLLENETFTWHMDDCKREQSTAIVGQYEVTGHPVMTIVTVVHASAQSAGTP